MINWYITLYLGVILLLYLFPYIGSFPSLTDYSEGRLGYGGLSSGTKLLLSRLISGDLLALTLLIVISYGVLGGLGFALMVLTSLFLFTLTVHKLKNHQPARNILDLLSRRTRNYGYIYHCLILLGVNLGNMILQLAALKYLLGVHYLQSSFLIIFFLNVFTWAYTGLGGFDTVNRAARPQVFLVFLTTAIITVSIFLENGLAATYLDIANHRFKSLGLLEGSLLFISGVAIITSQYILDHSLWHSVYNLKPQRQNSIFMLTILCVLAIPLGYSAITVYGLTQGLGVGGSLVQILEKNNSVILLNLYVLTIFVTVISSYALNLLSAVLIFLNLPKRKSSIKSKQSGQIKSGYLFALIFNLLVSATFLLGIKLSLLELFLFLGIIYTSLAIPFLHTLFAPSQQRNFAFFPAFLSLLIGAGFYLRSGSYYTPLLCLISGIVFQAISTLINKIHKNITKTD